RRGVPRLVDLAEAAAGGGAGRQAVLLAVDVEILLQVGCVERGRHRDDGGRGAVDGQAVGRGDVGGAPAAGGDGPAGRAGAVGGGLRRVAGEAAGVRAGLGGTGRPRTVRRVGRVRSGSTGRRGAGQ